MNNFGNASPARSPDKMSQAKFDLSQLDCVFTLHDAPASASSPEEEKADLFKTPLVEYIDNERALSINKLFRDEDLYLGDAASACLDSQTLPMLFRNNHQRSLKKKEGKSPQKCFQEEALKELLCGAEKLPNLATYICQYSGLLPTYVMTLPPYSPLSVFVNPVQGVQSRCTLTELLTEVLRYTFQNIHDAVAQDDTAELEPEAVLPVENPVYRDPGADVQTPVSHTESHDDVAMSDIDASLSTKRRYKQWTEAEENELFKVMEDKLAGEQAWEELAVKLNRTVCSLRAKAKTLGRKTRVERKPKEDAESWTYFRMISVVLNSFSDNRASKEDIVPIICERYGMKREEIEKAVTQCLAKKFERCSGIYKLKDGVDVPSKDKANTSVKERLIYILGMMLPNREGTLAQIRQMYQQEFGEGLDTKMSAEGNQAVWEKTVSKTLLKCSEFDKARAKTKYTFRRVFSL